MLHYFWRIRIHRQRLCWFKLYRWSWWEEIYYGLCVHTYKKSCELSFKTSNCYDFIYDKSTSLSYKRRPLPTILFIKKKKAFIFLWAFMVFPLNWKKIVILSSYSEYFLVLLVKVSLLIKMVLLCKYICQLFYLLFYLLLYFFFFIILFCKLSRIATIIS